MDTTFYAKESLIISTLDQPNLKVLENQLSYESILIKKYTQYSKLCEDTQLKNLCHRAAEIHKENYKILLNYLNIYQ